MSDHINISHPRQLASQEFLTRKISQLTAEVAYQSAIIEQLRNDLGSIFTRIQRGDNVELWVDENNMTLIGELPWLGDPECDVCGGGGWKSCGEMVGLCQCAVPEAARQDSAKLKVAMAALKRLASNEAFDVATSLITEEVGQRIDYARQQIKEIEDGAK